MIQYFKVVHNGRGLNNEENHKRTMKKITKIKKVHVGDHYEKTKKA